MRQRAGPRLGHAWGMKQGEAGDSKGQQRCPADSCALALTSREGSEQRRSAGHAVHGMQGVRGSNPLSSTPGHGPIRPGARPFLALAQQLPSNRYCAAVALSVGVADRAALGGWCE
jgi:hypothetical protein